ncbi:lipase maturation factor 2 [Microplitis demolitor]|uniref:lipase maturation factor 2 n=1 Tax=Microplitis demolitor TaxID=69319 RepID=UPI0004CD55D9|nr:lipase maturation factor 2 [Microplitis demolitor]
MIEVRYTRNLFLRGICIIYLFAFVSFYVQIPGLYGDNGLLPARTQLDFKGKPSLLQKFSQKPTLAWFAPYLGLNVEYTLDVIALLGAVISFLGFISQRFCTWPIFMALWSLYYSLYQVGQVFMQYQWDTLLLEAGFLCILIAPLYVPAKGKISTPSDTVTFWCVRWLLFRFMFSSGVAKLASGCPAWWSLDALSRHFEVQCLPGVFAWFAHHIPSWYLRLTTVTTIIFELVIPFLYFFPNRKVRQVAFYIQIYQYLHIMATGNWNFRDFLVICLSIGLLDDQFFYKKKSKHESSRWKNHLSTLVCILVYAAVVYGTIVFYRLRLLDNWTIQSEIGFTQQEFTYYLGKIIVASFIIGIVSLGFTVADSITHSLLSTKGSINTIITFITTVFYTIAVCLIFATSLVPFSSLHPSHNITIPTQVKHMYMKVEPYRIVNGYTLFRRMTGLDGRPEIIIEGSNDIDGPWKEYEFLYKPGNVNHSMPFVAPHSPRLDWQMWFAALGTYHQNPWIMSLTYRLLSNQKEVLALLNNVEKPFGDKPPKYVRANLYHYHFVPWERNWNSESWWTREKVGEYFPIFSRDHPPLLEYLKKLNILHDKPTTKVTNKVMKTVLDSLRMLVEKIEPSLLIWSIFTAACAIIMTSKTTHPSKKK